MNITLFCFIIVFVDINCLYVDTRQKDIKKRSILLRKLQSLDYNSQNSSQIQTWSETLADAFVNRIFAFTTRSNEGENNSNDGTFKKNLFVKPFTILLEWYKVNIYDKYIKNITIRNSANNLLLPNKTIESSKNPKSDVEIIEPAYRGKMCDNCKSETDEIEVKRNNHCEDGLEMDENGNCVDKKVSKFILAIPYHCPIGYRRDSHGYCRITLQ
ncbi:unnamed protein product [Danaus chrysippus]|uniref:(African queen) hypothetical protein n=1 Tax=Danaus chrysippus TaxID=151541 RepID=A0A8J2R088_9NEOP|nr:unnamed protein product [Danaus chrysippus]